MEYIDPLMPVGRVMIFSVPNLKKLLAECATSVLNFEHTILLTEDYIEYLLDEFNYAIEDRKYYKDHSVIYACRKVKDNEFQHDSDGIKKRLKSLYLQNRELFLRYVKFHKDEIKKLNDYMMSVPQNRGVYLFGAHITTQFYIAFGMRTDRITGILDNDRFKWNKRVSGTGWNVMSPDVLKNMTKPVVILPSSPYSGEIRQQILNEINSSTEIYEIGKH